VIPDHDDVSSTLLVNCITRRVEEKAADETAPVPYGIRFEKLVHRKVRKGSPTVVVGCGAWQVMEGLTVRSAGEAATRVSDRS
jgi:hypothetical protein